MSATLSRWPVDFRASVVFIAEGWQWRGCSKYTEPSHCQGHGSKAPSDFWLVFRQQRAWRAGPGRRCGGA